MITSIKIKYLHINYLTNEIFFYFSTTTFYYTEILTTKVIEIYIIENKTWRMFNWVFYSRVISHHSHTCQILKNNEQSMFYCKYKRSYQAVAKNKTTMNKQFSMANTIKQHMFANIFYVI